MTKVWFITGASRGLGLAMARSVLGAGHKVVAAARNPAPIGESLQGFEDRFLAVPLDVTKPEQAEAAVAAAKDRFGRIDVLVNNAGYGQIGAFELVSDELIRKEFATNVFGVMHVTRAVLPIMRQQRSGHILMMSSVSGVCADGGASVYNASKFALEGFSEGLALELADFGIKVTIVEPGYFRTDFLDASSVHQSDIEIDDYAGLSKRVREFLDDKNQNQLGDPKKLGPALIRLTESDKPPSRFIAGSDALERIREKYERLRRGTDRWADLSASTDGAW